jgi:hypothetical protein
LTFYRHKYEVKTPALHNTGRFKMFSVITNIYNKKTKVKNIDAPMLTRVWQELEYRIDVCRVACGAHIELL